MTNEQQPYRDLWVHEDFLLFSPVDCGSSREDDWTTNLAKKAEAEFQVSQATFWNFVPPDADEQFLAELSDRIAWETFLRDLNLPEVSNRVRKFWEACRRVVPRLPVPITVRNERSIDISWHQDTRYLEIEVAATGRAQCFRSMGDGPRDSAFDLDNPPEHILAPLRTFAR